LAIFLWLTGRSPVSFECLMRPIDVMNSAIMEKFCRLGQRCSESTAKSIQSFHAGPCWLGALRLSV
jgi:hypothetical protein